jgi:pyruvate dehydrogenase E2 component (dihydrolipoamide acetyltransferase)
MVRPITLPKLGQSEEEGKIVKWRKREGDTIAKGDILFEIETDKAVLEVESYYEGTLLKIVVLEGETVPVQSLVAYVGDPGEPIPEVKQPTPPPPRVEAPRPAAPAPVREALRPPAPQPAGRQVVVAAPLLPAPAQAALAAAPTLFRISPRAARLAKESAIDPTPITGTGPFGRIVEADVKAYLAAKGYDRLRITPSAKDRAIKEGVGILTLEGTGAGGRITVNDVERALAERPKPMSKMRQIIAQRLTHSYTTQPHFFVTVAADMTDLLAFRAELKAKGADYTVTDFILEAVTLSLVEFPTVNSTTDGKNVRWHSKVQLGLAVALEQGLVVPVIRNAEDLTLAEIHERATELTAKARAGKLTPDQMTGSTFTISNMGMMDVENFTAIINPGESAILAVSSTLPTPVVKDGKVVIRSIMKMTLSSDHRIIDGALAARFLNAIKQKLEEISLWRRMV